DDPRPHHRGQRARARAIAGSLPRGLRRFACRQSTAARAVFRAKRANPCRSRAPGATSQPVPCAGWQLRGDPRSDSGNDASIGLVGAPTLTLFPRRAYVRVRVVLAAALLGSGPTRTGSERNAL